MRKKPLTRRDLFEQVATAGRDMTAQGVMYYTRIAERFGLSVSDWRALDLLRRYGPMTAGDFAGLTGLTPGGVTALVNRLAATGAVKREADARDGRRVILSAAANPGGRRAAATDATLQAALARIYENYSDEQLAVIARFMREVVTTVRAQTERLQAWPAGRKKARPGARRRG